MKTFKNKTVLITGGPTGIGKATALAFAKEGANVVVSGRRVAAGEEVAREITSASGNGLFVQTDVAREDDIIALVEKTIGAFGALHIAFNNAGFEGQFGPLTTEQTVEHYHQVCDINVRGVLLSMKHEIPAMLRSGGGSIVNNSSIGGHIGFPDASVYVASKFAVIGLTKTAALEFAKQGVRVNSVSPGTIQTEMFDRAFGEGETDIKKTLETQNPVGRVGTPEEIASAVLWLSSPGAAFTTARTSSWTVDTLHNSRITMGQAKTTWRPRCFIQGIAHRVSGAAVLLVNRNLEASLDWRCPKSRKGSRWLSSE